MAKRGSPIPLALAALLAAYWISFPGICSTSMDSPTYDEPMFIAEGIYILKHRDYSMTVQHPPLSKILMALPLIGMDLKTPEPAVVVEENYVKDMDNPLLRRYVIDYPKDQLAHNPYYIGYHFLYTYNRDKVDEIFLRCRRVIQLMHYMLVFTIFLIVRKLYGDIPGIAAAVLTSFDPNLIAHGHLCTTDLPAALFSVLSFLALLVLIKRDKPNPLLAILWGLSLGLMCATKFSSLIFIPIHAGFVIWTFRRDWKGLLTCLVVAAMAAFLVCFIAGNFSLNPYIIPLKQLALSLKKGRPSYLLGHYSTSGFPLYYFAALLFKMPSALILMFLAGVALNIKRIKSSISEIALWTFPGVFLLSTIIFHGNNLGLRHTLIIYPFLIAIAASVFFIASKKKFLLTAGVVLTVLVLIESVPAMSNSIPFFNIFTRKAAYDGKLLADSNIDWGQDLARLKTFMRTNGIDKIHLRYFGTADPYYHLLGTKYPQGDIYGRTLDIMGPEYNNSPGPPGWYAVSLQKLLQVRGKSEDIENDGLGWLTREIPYGRAGGSIVVYHYKG